MKFRWRRCNVIGSELRLGIFLLKLKSDQTTYED